MPHNRGILGVDSSAYTIGLIRVEDALAWALLKQEIWLATECLSWCNIGEILLALSIAIKPPFEFGTSLHRTMLPNIQETTPLLNRTGRFDFKRSIQLARTAITHKHSEKKGSRASLGFLSSCVEGFI